MVITPFTGETDIFITPGYEFGITDGLFTNFHSQVTLLMLVSACWNAPNWLAYIMQLLEITVFPVRLLCDTTFPDLARYRGNHGSLSVSSKPSAI